MLTISVFSVICFGLAVVFGFAALSFIRKGDNDYKGEIRLFSFLYTVTMIAVTMGVVYNNLSDEWKDVSGIVIVSFGASIGIFILFLLGRGIASLFVK